jgi:hypothetical protein
MGEYSSGKSELLNLLLRRRMLPTKVTATDLPAVWLSMGKTEKVKGLSYDGTLHDLALSDLTSSRAAGYLAIRIETDAEVLAQTDIIDTPGISDPRMSTQIVEEIARYSDFVVWCSPANQAWRQTEKAFWKSMPAAVKRHSILMLTRADKIRSPSDLRKVVGRCGDETAGQFSAVLSISTLAAMAADRDASSSGLREAWTQSGAEGLLRQINNSIAAAAKSCAQREKLPDPIVQTKSQPRKAKAPDLLVLVQKATSAPDEISNVLSGLKDSALDFSSNERTLATIGHLFIQLERDNGLTEEHRSVLSRSLSVKAAFPVNVPKLLVQIEHEIADFSNGPWYELGR